MARHVLVNCDAVADRLERVSRGHLGRIVVIPNGVDLARFAPAPDQKGHGDRVRIGTLANLRPEKGVEDFVRAAALVRERCPKAHFMIWGEGPLRTDLERLVSALSLEGAVELGGATATPELVLRGLDIFVLPSLSEACSNALLEAMATRLPVVATCVGGNLSIVEDEVSGLLVPPGDTTALAKAITRLIEEPGSAANLAARGQDRIRAEFSMDRMLARIEALYDQALSGRGV
jgi:glycosyltransferase involved in cell wall biosynthesis